MEEEYGEQEKASFLSNKAPDKNSSKDSPVEVKRDLSKNYKKRLRRLDGDNPFFLTVFDHFLVFTIVTVNVVGFWRGLFGIFSQLRDLYHLLTLHLLGSVIICHFTLARNTHKRHLMNNGICSSIVRKGYTYVFGCACIAQWAGLWFFLDAMTGLEVYPPLTYSVVCSAILICLKLYRNVLAPPVTFCTDHLSGYFEFPTAFNIHPSEQGQNVLTKSSQTLRMRSCNCDANPFGYNRFISVLDAVLSGVVISPAVIAYWRGTWYLSDFYVFPENLRISLIASTVVGTLLQLIFALSQNFLQRVFHPDRHRIVYYVISRLYSYLYSVACVNLWRGEWEALDFYSGTDVVQVAIPTAVSLLVLVGMKTMRNLSSAPVTIALDSPTNYFHAPTMFRLRGTSDTPLYVLDCFFTVFVVGSLVVFVWRGIWCLTDVFLYPENEKYSSFSSLAIGYGIIIVVFSMQTAMENLCEKVTGLWRVLVADIYVFIAFIGTINLWRGIWNLLNIYFLPESPVLSCWITHLGSFAFLVLINCSNSTLVRGVYLDGEEGKKCVAFPISYLSLIFKKHLNKKKIENETNHNRSSLRNVCDVEKAQKENSENGKVLTETAVEVRS